MSLQDIEPAPIAEHGISALVSIFSCEKTNTFLFDGGVSENGVIHNAELLGIRIDQISGIILSHGHFDHFTGLPNVLKRIPLCVRQLLTFFFTP